jgi:hypothetical protein
MFTVILPYHIRSISLVSSARCIATQKASAQKSSSLDTAQRRLPLTEYLREDLRTHSKTDFGTLYRAQEKVIRTNFVAVSF